MLWRSWTITPICEISEELRGERLREVAVEVLRQLSASGDPVHYRAWFDALVESGYVRRKYLALYLRTRGLPG